MQFRVALFALALASADAQSTCPGVNFLAARTVNLKPTSTAHIDVIRQPDGSNTGFEAADAAPYAPLSATPHFERQFATCLPHPIRFTPSAPPPVANPPGAGSQLQASMALGSANFFLATISADTYTLHFDIFDSQHNLLSETNFSNQVPTLEPGDVNDQFESLLLTDLNGDGKPDLVAVFSAYRDIADIQGGVWVFLGNGDGTFQAGKRQPLTTNMDLLGALSAAAGDLNNDGKPDLVLSAPGYVGTVIALGNGDGTFNPQTLPLLVPAPEGSAASVAIADLNGDGKQDLAVSLLTPTGTPVVAVYLGNGDGTFQTPVMYPILVNINGTPALAPVAIGDLNGDGIPDIATATGSILYGDGKGAFPTRRDYVPSGSGSVMIADFDGDGIPDLIFGNGNGTFVSGNTLDTSATVLFGDGAGGFVGAPVTGVGSTTGFQGFAVGDFHGNGIPAAVLAIPLTYPDFELTTLPGEGNGLFSAGVTQSFSESVRFNIATHGVVADFNHDGKPDIALLADTDLGEVVVIFFGRGDGSFAAPMPIALPDNTINFMAAPDVNGDGIPDLVFSGNVALYVWLGKGDGTFTPAFSTPVDSPSVAFADFNGDGKLDIAFANLASTTVSVLLGKGDGTFPNVTKTTLPSAAFGDPGQMTAADFNGDGHADLAISLGATGNGPTAIAVLLGSGNGTFSAIHSTAGFMDEMAAADFNGDRIPDLVGVGTNGAIVVRLGNGDGTFQPEAVVYPQNTVFAVADLNRDGFPDLVLVEPPGIAAFLNLKPALDHGRDHHPIN